MAGVRGFAKLSLSRIPSLITQYQRKCLPVRYYYNYGEMGSGLTSFDRWNNENLNEVRLVGITGKDPVKYEIPWPLVAFSLVTNRYIRDVTGNIKQTSTWHNILINNRKLQDYAIENITKGCRLYVFGYITYSEKLDELSQTRNVSAKIIASNIDILRKPSHLSREEEDREEGEVDTVFP